jgi:hypothetical protein
MSSSLLLLCIPSRAGICSSRQLIKEQCFLSANAPLPSSNPPHELTAMQVSKSQTDKGSTVIASANYSANSFRHVSNLLLSAHSSSQRNPCSTMRSWGQQHVGETLRINATKLFVLSCGCSRYHCAT